MGGLDFVALRCAGCAIFQVQQQRAAGKWQCRACGAKQSLTRIYARDAKAANVRTVVHELSRLQGESERVALAELADGHGDDAGEGANQIDGPIVVDFAASRWRHLVDDLPDARGAEQDSGAGEADGKDSHGERCDAVGAGWSTASATNGRVRRPEYVGAKRAAVAEPRRPPSGPSKWAKFV
ncbi:hypothetical protein KFE25_002520 [Diacronema lutheri]|uniref:MRN complex-interacting protein N-terminal domain-containing protein n=1 Tax=Diacronema lutheri TaxID=2081491 RepID=A0A8J6C956_DIALT|nr:hypothetical protein KFE25_002520 [Diacronema lutheri]